MYKFYGIKASLTYAAMSEKKKKKVFPLFSSLYGKSLKRSQPAPISSLSKEDNK
jgi:hypothetical protein